MEKNKQAVIHYSGGTDSTCVTCLKAKDFDKIHLISYKRFGIFNTENIETNTVKLKQLFGEDKFIRKIIDINKIYKLVVYDRYFYNLKKYGFFNLAVCGLCKMAMHMRTIVYCIDNNISYVFDGANKFSGDGIATDQIKEYMDSIFSLYGCFNISYQAPVYDMPAPKTLTWESKLGMQNKNEEGEEITTGTILKQYGFFDTDNVKGSRTDKKMQARCLQQIMPNIALNYYYIQEKGRDKYKEQLKNFFGEKSERMAEYIKQYISDRKNSKLAKCLR